ncbi:conserved hypothetical protein [Tenacibaculum maritimum]|uniref:phage portal protein family protein n=1 Tax=Tenacibaculum maritimum TaxID=107401 RepID=UPI0012E6565C|nr:DUF935 family protein [Tenacibaculum maritimum]MCD9582292.1 DUF935 family protein [Tenacibaculum maritimum]MCD9636674.1 DUF935 family protein [Tenacibaculum maritimum]CAA0144760.1 conserved hypothetical protein [Tenacibaculum maritimum]CAA0193186.1 conserved hypothetical protein [Tenacibaculum maritimum]
MRVLRNIFGYDIGVKKTTPVSNTEKDSGKGRRNKRITKIGQNFKDASRKDIDKWRMALKMIQNPEQPKYDIYYDLIDDLLTDGHLQSQIQMRKMSTLNTNFQIINRKTGAINEELTFVFQQQWFYKFLNHALDSVLFGTSLVEFIEFQNERISHHLIPRRNVITTQKKIIPDLQKPEFIDYSDDYFKAWLIQIGDDGDLGILNNIIPNLIWIKNVTQAWAEFCEKYGMPLITATTSTTDSTTIDNVHEMLLELGEASVGTFPHGTEIKFQEASRTDAYNTYLMFIKTNQDVVSKQLVGSTMLSDQGTNRSQTEVHERSLDNKISQADKREITFVVNDQLIPLMELQGYTVSEDDVFEFKTAEQDITLPELWEITNGLLTSGHEVQVEWLSKTFNIPIDGKKKRLNPTPNIPKNIDAKYPISCCPEKPVALGKNISKRLQELSDLLAKAVYNKEETAGILGEMAAAEGLELLNGLRSGLHPKSAYVGADLLMLQLMEYNLFEFTASKAEARLAAMSSLLIDKQKQKLREYSEFKSLAQKEVKELNTNYLRTEYNLSVAIGQNSAAYVRFMAEKDSVTNLVQYQTAGDNKVRSAHEVLDGKIFDLNDTEAMDLLPPNGYGCRCEFIQFIGDTEGKIIKGSKAKEILRESDPKYKGSSFEINRANLNQVFTKKDFYTSTNTLPKKLKKMTFDTYGLTAFKVLKKGLKKLKTDKTITKDNAKELFKSSGTIKQGKQAIQYMGMTDYLKRKMIVTQDVFDTHISKGDYQLFPLLKDVLKTPDEVWYYENSKGKFSSRYIKFFNDMMLLIDCEIDETQGLHITDWKTYKGDEKNIRKGLLIKSKNI